MEDEGLEEIRRKKLEASQAGEEQRKLLLAVLEPDAYSRLANVGMSSPKMYQSVVGMLLSLVQSGKLRGRVGDAQLKELLGRLASRRPEGSITFKRK